MVSHSGEYSGDLGEPEIVITLDKEAKTLSVTDNGIGMTGEEVKSTLTRSHFLVLKSLFKSTKPAPTSRLSVILGWVSTRRSWWQSR